MASKAPNRAIKLFGTAVAALTTAICASLPAIFGPRESLRSREFGSPGRAMQWMVVLEIALALPLVWALMVATSLGAALWLSAIHAEYRDVGQVLPFCIQALFLLTPVAYPSALISEGWRHVYALNPLVAVVEGSRWALLGGEAPVTQLLVGTAVAVALLASGLLYFFSREDSFPDVV